MERAVKSETGVCMYWEGGNQGLVEMGGWFVCVCVYAFPGTNDYARNQVTDSLLACLPFVVCNLCSQSINRKSFQLAEISYLEAFHR